MTEIVKNCKHHGALTRDEVNISSYLKDGSPSYKCKKCQKAAHDKYYEQHADKELARQKIYRKANPEKIKQWHKDERKRLSYRISHRKRTNRGAANLGDFYVKKLLCKRSNLRHADIPPEMVEMKRASLLLKREIKKKMLLGDKNDEKIS